MKYLLVFASVITLAVGLPTRKLVEPDASGPTPVLEPIVIGPAILDGEPVAIGPAYVKPGAAGPAPVPEPIVVGPAVLDGEPVAIGPAFIKPGAAGPAPVPESDKVLVVPRVTLDKPVEIHPVVLPDHLN